MYDVFISYSRSDYMDKEGNIIPGNPVSRVMDAFESAGITYWFDNQCIYHGDDFAETIVTNIESSDIFVFLSTANSNKSPWTRKEIASAHQFGKKIIPVKIDGSHYDKAVMFRIVDLDYIDYAKNPDKGIEELVDTVNGLLSDKREAERRKKEEEERRRREMEQARKKAIAEIELQSEKLKNEVYRLKLDHKQLLLNIQRIEDEQERARLSELVQGSFLLEEDDKEAEKALMATVKSLSEENARLKEEVKQLKKEGPSRPKVKVDVDDGRRVPTLIKVLVIIAIVVSCLVFLVAFDFYLDYPIPVQGGSILTLMAIAGLVLVLNKRKTGFFVFIGCVLAISCLPFFCEEPEAGVASLVLAVIIDAAAFGLLKLPVRGVKTWDLLS